MEYYNRLYMIAMCKYQCEQIAHKLNVLIKYFHAGLKDVTQLNDHKSELMTIPRGVDFIQTDHKWRRLLLSLRPDQLEKLRLTLMTPARLFQ